MWAQCISVEVYETLGGLCPDQSLLNLLKDQRPPVVVFGLLLDYGRLRFGNLGIVTALGLAMEV